MIRPEHIVAVVLLGLMLLLMTTSTINENATMDELAHIPSGYSYVRFLDMRLNPEHPPLLKDLAGLAMLSFRPNFPTNDPAWTESINGQWDAGRIFLYESGNDPHQLVPAARAPFMALTILLGWIMYRWARGRYGNAVALLALFFYAFSPSFLAHGRYVTTDVGAAFGFFIGIIAFLRFLDYPSKRNIIIAGIALGVALLLKFSLVLLVPFFIGITALWAIVTRLEHLQGLALRARIAHHIMFGARLFAKLILVGVIAGIIVSAVYIVQTINYPPERQRADTVAILGSFPSRPLADAVVWMSDKPILRGPAEYLLGLFMVSQRSEGGNTTYFLGQVTRDSWWYYFPTMYLVKETLALHILTGIALLIGILSILRAKTKSLHALRTWSEAHFVSLTLLLFIAFYWGYSMRANLNIGVRHVLPTFPFIYILVAKTLTGFITKNEDAPTLDTNIGNALRSFYRLYIRPIPLYGAGLILLFWIFLAIVVAWPNYLGYFNEITAMTMPPYAWAADSNLDWGQDLLRLKTWMNQNNIEKIRLDYFGGGNPQYEFGDRFIPWNSPKGPPEEGWLAVSATFRQGSWGTPVGRFSRNPEDGYDWLKNKTPITMIGTSLFIYRFP